MDRGIRPYASSAKTYNEMMDEQTEQYYRSMNYDIKPSLKQPYCCGSYTEMMYLYSGGEQRKTKTEPNPIEIINFVTQDTLLTNNFVDIEKNFLWLDFFGVDGATTWKDKAQGLTATVPTGVEIDTAQHWSGSSSLLVPRDAGKSTDTVYTIPNITDDFEYIVVFKYNTIDGLDSIYPLNIYSDGDVDVRGQITASGSEFYISDREGNEIFNDYITATPADTWTKWRLKVTGQRIYFYINETLYNSWIADITRPLGDVNGLFWGNWNATDGHNMWLGYVRVYKPV
jgi:hypothetical protein